MSETLPAPRRVDIKAIRERFSLTQADIADELHVDERTIRRWERGASSPSPMAVAHVRMMQRRLAAEREQGTQAGTKPGAVSPAPRPAPAAGHDPGLLPRRRLPSL